MARGTIALTYEEKVAFLKQTRTYTDEDAGFAPAPKIERVGAQSIAWEMEFGDLDAWRRHVGFGRAILPMVRDENADQAMVKSKALAASVKNRMLKCFADESWNTYVADGSIWLSYQGSRKVKQAPIV